MLILKIFIPILPTGKSNDFSTLFYSQAPQKLHLYTCLSSLWCIWIKLCWATHKGRKMIRWIWMENLKTSPKFTALCLRSLAGLQVEADQRVMMVAEGNSTYLECLPRSRHAAVTWYKQAGENSPELNQVDACEDISIETSLTSLNFNPVFIRSRWSQGTSWWLSSGAF